MVDIWYKAATFDARLLKDLQRDVAKASSGSSSRSSIGRLPFVLRRDMESEEYC